ncbi:MAG: DUF1643 domain-containing protein [Synergistaceae bacterium]|jgi:hypothetical protein|nr:DUF1643 domain-containing protein [Synergistaceae bacterium]
MLTEKVIIKTEAVFSDDRAHRYILRKEWDVKKPRATIIMTNPSTADMLTMDYTTLYIMNNIVRLDFGSIDIVNLVSKTTLKLNVKDDMDIKPNPENLDFILKSAEKSDKVILAWGKLGENNKKVRDVQDFLLERLKPFKDKLCVIASENCGSGFHPLAPQIRFSWALKKYEFPKEPEAKPVSP